VDTALKIILAIVVAALVLAAMAGITTFTDGVVTPGKGAVTALEGHSAGGTYYAYRDSEYIMGQGGAAVEMSPADIVGWVSAMIFPANHTSAANENMGRWTLDESSSVHRGWVLAIIGGIPLLLGAWIGLKWLFGFLFGAD
jgi:hypothetical protein